MRVKFAKFKKGFTLTELIVVVSILSLLTLLISTIIGRSFQTYRFNREGASYQEQALKAILDFEKNVRGATEVVSSDPDSFQFYVYLPNDSYPAPSLVRYFYEDGKLKRGTIHPEGAGPVFEYPPSNEQYTMVVNNVVSQNVFEYYNDVSEAIDEPVAIDAVRMVKIKISIDKEPNVAPNAVNEETAINLRNLKTNL